MQRSCEDLWLPHRVEGGGEDRNLDQDGVGDQDYDGDGDDGEDGDNDQVTAITILTFGTSQIDLFASKVGSFINYVALCFSKVLLLHLYFDLFCLIILFFFFSTRSQQSATLRRTVRLEMWSRQTRSEFFSGFSNSYVNLLFFGI